MINVFFIDVIFESFFLSICWVIKIDEIRFIFYWKDRWWKVLKGYRFFFNVNYIKILMKNIDVVWVYKGR